MRILLCNRTNGTFFQAEGQWTHDPAQARNFQASPKAILFAEQNQLRNVEVYWDFDDPEYNVRLPISSDDCAMAA